MRDLRRLYLPAEDRTANGYLRWRLWLPFWCLGCAWGYLGGSTDAGSRPPWLILIGAMGLPYLLALLLTQRKPTP